MDTIRCWCKCLFKLCVLLVLVAEFIALPTVGLVWWFVVKSPEQFLLTCIGISLLWIGTGIAFFLSCIGVGKYRQLSGKAHKYIEA